MQTRPLAALLLAAALLPAPLLAQANAVAGLDVQIYEVTDIGYYGRHGGAYPTGEAAFMVGHSHCNAGTVDVPWVATIGNVMIDTYPKIAFLLARESDGRMVQISGQGHAKHSTVPFNFSAGPCAPCVVTGGPFFFVGCSDTYGSGINASQFNLGPNHEIDPWLGTWAAAGSYFDRGDPPVAGAAAIDSVRSLTSPMVAAFGPVKNRIVVRESELVAGAAYHCQAQLVVQGEPGTNRGNNVRSRPVSITGTGTGWSAVVAGPSSHGSVLTRWQGATTEVGGNGTDDGHFLVAVKVTGPVGGVWHYEYAIHNLDNSRAGAAVRIPLDAAAIVRGHGFRDVDGNPLDDWSFSRTATELTVAAAANNALEWNTIYNVWFDCTVAPSFGRVTIDQARPGPGAPSVDVASEVPSGLPMARKQAVGGSCGGCRTALYESFATAGAFDLANRSMTHALNGGTYTVADTGAAFVPAAGAPLALGDDGEARVALPFVLPYPGGTTTALLVCSNGFVSPAASNGTSYQPSAAQLLGGAPRWAAAWHDFNPTAAGSGPVLVDATASEVRITWNGVASFGGGGAATFQYRFRPDGTVHVVWGAMSPAGNGYVVGWSPGALAQDPGAADLSAVLGTPTPLCTSSFAGITLDTSARPILGTSFQWTTSGIPPGSSFLALLRSPAQAVPAIDLGVVGMPGCMAHVVDPIASVVVLPAASVQHAEPVPNAPSLIGFVLVGQSLVYRPPLTPLGFVVSNGMVLTLGL